MADNRLTTLVKKSELQYVEGSPLLLEANALYLDTVSNNCIAQIKWKSIDPRIVKAVMIELDGFDAFDQSLEPVTFQYGNLTITQGTEFGDKVAIPVSSRSMVRYNVILKAVSFADGTVWHSEKSNKLLPLPKSKPQVLDGEFFEQYKRDLSKKGIRIAADFQPQSVSGLWQCGCGSWQYDNSPCLKCRATQEVLSSLSDQNTLESNLSAYKAEQERLRIENEKKAEEARIAREKAEIERKRQEEEQARRRAEQMRVAEREARRAKKKKNRTLAIIAVFAVIAVVAFVVVTKIVIPSGHYSQGETAYQAGKYEDAYNAFVEAGDYQDAHERAQESAYSQGELLFNQGQYEQAFNFFGLAGEYGSAATQQANSALAQADKLIQMQDYSNAAKWYSSAGDRSKAASASSMAYAANNERTWLHHDTYDDKPNVLPEGVFLFATSTSSGKYSTTNEYGVLKIGDNGWITNTYNYSWVHYYEKQELILAGTDYKCTIIDLQSGSMADVTTNKPLSILGVSDEGIVTYRIDEDKYDYKYGFFNRQGQVIAEPQFDEAHTFSEGLVPVKKDRLWGYMDSNGNIVIDFKYTDARPFENGYAIVGLDAHKVKQGDMYVSYKNGWGLIDITGKHIIEPNWVSFEIMSDGFIRAGNYRKSGKDYVCFYALFDINGNMILEDKYTTIGTEDNGLRYVATLAEGEKYYPNTTAGWVDSSGRMVINLISLGIDGSDDVGKFINGCALISHWYDGICDAVISIKGKVLWKGTSHYWETRQDSLGNIVIISKTRWYSDPYEYTYYKTLDGEMIEISKSEYEILHKQSEEKDRADHYGDEDRVDTTTSFYTQWASVSRFSDEGIALVSLNKNGPYGFVTNKETLLVDAIYEDGKLFQNGYAIVKLNGKWGCIDSKGDYTIEPQYDLLSSVTPQGTLLAQIGENSYALLNISGQVLVENITSVMGTLSVDEGELPSPNGQTLVRLGDSNQWTLIDAAGNRVF